MAKIIYAADFWRTNAELIADVAKLGYLKKEWRTLDPTYGNGTWWKLWRPDDLVAPDGYPDTFDFRDTHFTDNAFDAVAFDPPYVSVGGRATSTIEGYHQRYGIDVAPNSPAGVQSVINDGLKEMQRVVKPNGIILCKCQDYISSGKLWLGTHHTLTWALAIGLKVEDRIEHLSQPRPQPDHVRQVHARRNLSTLFVFRKAK